MKRKKNPHWGSTLDDFLNEEGIREAAKAEAVTRVLAWQLAEEMKRQGEPGADRPHPQGQGQRDDRNAAARRRDRRPRAAA